MNTQNVQIWGQGADGEIRWIKSVLIGNAERIAAVNYFDLTTMWFTNSKKNPVKNPETVQQKFDYVRGEYTIEIVRIAGLDPFGKNFLPEARETVTVQAWTAHDAANAAVMRMKMRVMGQELCFYHNGKRV